MENFCDNMQNPQKFPLSKPSHIHMKVYLPSCDSSVVSWLSDVKLTSCGFKEKEMAGEKMYRKQLTLVCLTSQADGFLLVLTNEVIPSSIMAPGNPSNMARWANSTYLFFSSSATISCCLAMLIMIAMETKTIIPDLSILQQFVF